MNNSRLTIEDIENRLVAKHGDEIILAPDQIYINSKTKMKFIDREYGEFEAVLDSVINRGTGGHHGPARAHGARWACPRSS